eukprot:c11375_g2_i8.p2 GENE.c11375_g2_i8~~c11375_g2_i8.p2  ORF type:complete len:185 (-),score=55.48 c11375_g2_i8:55-609(-)
MSCLLGFQHYNNDAKLISQTRVLTLQAIGCIVAVNVVVLTPTLMRITASSHSAWCYYPHTARGSLALLGVYAAYVISLAATAVVVSLRIRHVPSQFNETTHIARATYNLVTFGAGMVLVALLTQSSSVRLLLLSLSILMGVGSFVVSVYLPKISLVRHQTTTAAAAAITESIFRFKSSIQNRAI